MKLDFSTSNVLKRGDQFPKLRLETGARARIALPEAPEVGWVHNLTEPVLSAGKPTFETRKSKKGEEYEVYATKFVTRHLCLGDVDVLEDRGFDEKRCPSCSAAREITEIPYAQRRFAMHVLEYNTKSGTFEVAKPFGVSVKVWPITDKMFTKLSELKETWGDLNTKDLLLGPCKDAQYQNFEIQIAPNAEWLSQPSRRTFAEEALAENQAEDLMAFIGRDIKHEYLESDVARLRRQWQIALGATNVADADVDVDLDLAPDEVADLEELLKGI